MVSLNWQELPNGNWTARDEIAPHFVVKYTIWGDEDDCWFGQYEQWERVGHKEADEYYQLDLDDVGVGGTGLSRETLMAGVQSRHTKVIRPAIEETAAAYKAWNEEDYDDSEVSRD